MSPPVRAGTASAEYLTVEASFRLIDDDTLAEILEGLPVLGARIADGDDGLAVVTVYLEPTRWEAAARVRAALEAAGGRRLRAGSLADRDWLAAYRRLVRPFPVGRRWWIDPHPETPTPAPEDRRRLAVEPGRAFGTGTHESTRLMLLALERIPLAGRTVLDVGTGSGILAVAAALEGAAWVVGLDVDLPSVVAALRTSRLQGRPAPVSLFAGGVEALDGVGFDIVLCNMLWEHMRPLIPRLAACLAPTGVLVLSGLLAVDRPVVASLCRRHGVRLRSETRLGEWIGLVGGHG